MGSLRHVLVLLVCGACAPEGERLVGELRGRGFALGSGESLTEGPEWIETETAGLGARLPSSFARGVEITLRAARQVAFVPIGARDVAARREGSVVVYREAWPGADVVYEAGGDKVKEIIWARDASAPRRFAFRMEGDLGPLRLAPPFAVDAVGHRVDLAYETSGGEIAVTIPGGLAYPVAIDPTVVFGAWANVTPAAGSPGARRNAAIAYDPVRQVAVMFGGRDDSGPASANAETWEWSHSGGNGVWTHKTMVATPPAARYGATMAWNRSHILLFGGADTNGIVKNELYSYDPTGNGKWNPVGTTGGPPAARQGHAMAEAGANGIVVFGGLNSSGNRLQDTWVLNGTTWTDATNTSMRPTTRWDAGMIWDGAHLVVHGGQGSNLLDDTWAGTFNAGKVDWIPVTAVTPSARRGHLFQYDVQRGLGLLFGGWDGAGAPFSDMWVWEPTVQTWSPMTASPTAPAARYGAASFYDSTRRRVVLFSGGPVAPVAGDTWEGDPTLKLDVLSGGNRTIQELATLSLNVVGRDLSSAATPITISYALAPTPPSGAVTGTMSGIGSITLPFSWTPGCTDSTQSPYVLAFTLSGAGQTISTAVNVTVTNRDCAPTANAPATATFKVGHAGSFVVTGSDPDGDPVTLTLQSMSPTPQATPTFAGGTFSFTPAAADMAGSPFVATFRATAGALFGEDTTTITVVPNAVPVITAPATASFAEGTAGGFDVSASDADGDTVNLTLTSVVGTNGTPAPLVAPTFSAGRFSWTPGFLDDGTYRATFTATDGIDPVTRAVDLTVANTNRDPGVTIGPPGDAKSVNEAQLIVFSATATDVDTDDTLSIVAAGVPAGATVTVSGPTATFSWTPSYDQGSVAGTPYVVTFTARDNHGAMTPHAVTVTVHNTNRPPVFAAVPAKTVAEGTLLTFTVSATDPDGDALTYSADLLPPGADFDPGSRTFSWVPSCTAADGGGSYQARFRVTDGAAPVTLTVGITVTGEVVVVTPSPIDFPAIRVGESAPPITVTIANGSATVPFIVQRVSTSLSVFPLTISGVPATVPPGGRITGSLGFVPAASAGYLDTLTVMTQATICAATNVSVSGIAQTPGVQVSRGSADFGAVRVGQTSAPVGFTVTNVGDAAFSVSSVALSNGQDFALTLVSPTSYPVTLAPTQTITFNVAAAPQTGGLKLGSVAVTTDIPGAGPTTLSLRVVGVAPGVLVSATTVDFGAVDVRGAGESRTLSVTNDGTATLLVSGAEIAGADAARFVITTGPPTPFSVPASATASFVILYLPVAETAGESAALRIQSDAPGEMLAEVPLLGRGVDRHLQLSATRLEFGNTFPGRAVEKTLTIANVGGAPLAFGSPAYMVAPSAWSLPDGVPPAVAAGGQANVRVRFDPGAAGAFDGTLTLQSDDGDTPMAMVTLAGTATLSPLTVAPVTLAADQVPVGTTRRLGQKVEIANVSNSETVDISRVCGGTASTCDESVFRADPGGPATLGPGDRLEVAVDFAPTEARTYQGRILLFIAGGTEPQYFVEVSGEGIADVGLHGGGCQTTGGSGLLPVLVVAALLFVWRRRAGIVLFLLSSVASAQTDTSFDLRVFRPRNASPGAYVTVEPPQVLLANAFELGAYVSYARNPLVAERGGMMTAAVSDRTETTLLLSYGLLGRAELSAIVPVITQSGTTGSGIVGASGTSLGDIGVEARLRLLRGLAVSAALAFPTGDDERYAGAGALTGGAALIAGAAFGRFRLAANAGVRFRGRSAEVATTRQGTAIAAGLGAGARLVATVDAIGEIYGAFGLSGDTSAVSPVEGVLGLRWWPISSLALTGGGGAGMHDGVGAADVRLFLGVTYAPRAAEAAMALASASGTAESTLDRDGDGIPDVRDKCPDEREDFDGVQDDDGCPDPDNDRDGIPDERDRCPNQAEDRDGFQDEDGCPDPDNDGDGIPDAQDRCPDEAEDHDGFQDDDGCFDPDNDGDGIPDILDQCVMEPETINGFQDDDGCPDAGEPAVVVQPDRLELKKPIDLRGDRLRGTASNVLLQVAAHLRAHPEIRKLRIVSHVARRGDPAADRRRSDQRGEAVRKFLVGKGVDPRRLEVKAMGAAEATGRNGKDDRLELLIIERVQRLR